MMGQKLGIVALACAFGVAILSGTGARMAAAERTTSNALALRHLHAQIVTYRRVTWHWQRLMGRGHTTATPVKRLPHDLSYRRWVRDLWRSRAVAAKRRARRPPHVRSWRCIHRFEASW